MATQAKTTPAEPPVSIEIITEERHKKFRDGTTKTVTVPVGKRVPVLLVVSQPAFKVEHEMQLRQRMKGIYKKHQRDGKLYFEVGATDEAIEDAIRDGIEFLKGFGVTAKRSVEFTPYLTRGEW